LLFVDRESFVPERTSEEVDPFVDEDFGNSKGSRRSDGFVTLFVELFEDGEKDVVGKIEEGSRRSSR